MPKIYTDSLTRRLYANDASMYEELPAGVSFPESTEQIAGLVRQAASEGFSLTARSAGTSLAGQATGGGVVMDVSRFMTEILSIDEGNRQATVQPGVIRDTLNREAGKHGLLFGPDTATTNRCMIGGMIGNNSSGSFSIKHKTTRDHVLDVEAVLSDGTITRFHPLTREELDRKCKLDSLEGRIYRGMLDLLNRHKESILEAYPHPEIMRRNTGYALDKLCEMDPITPGGRPFNLVELLCGSEGTLAMTGEATLDLSRVEPHRVLLIAHFGELLESMEAAVDAVEFEPSAVELVDRIILDATRGNIEQKKNRFFLEGDPEAILVIEIEGSDPAELEQRANALKERLESKKLGYSWPILQKPNDMRRVWELRKAGLGLLMGLGQESRSPTFVEDTAVRVQDLPAYVADFKEILNTYDTRCVFYAHASVGELHLRPIIDITTPEGLETMKAMAADVADLVRSYRGSLSGEHGDGRVRAPFIERVLGPEMIPLLRKVKTLWDPHALFNPGKIVDPKPMDADLRYEHPYRPVEVDTMFKWRKESGFGHALEQCNGAGVCRKVPESGGTMCPSYHATRDEKDSTRGRANLFRQMFLQDGSEGFGSEEIREGLKLCLSCKACKSECPANVDMARMKAEFLYGWQKRNGRSLATRLFGEPERFYPLAARFPGLSNRLMGSSPVRILLQELAGVDARRVLPAFAPEPFMSWFHSFRKQEPLEREDFKKDRPVVCLLMDPFTNYHEPEIGKSACRILQALGYKVLVPELQGSARPQISRGLLDEASERVEEVLNRLVPLVEQGIPVVGLEPSDLLTLRDEYPDLCSENRLSEVRRLAENSWLWEEFLDNHFQENPEDEALFRVSGEQVVLHGHCHTKALVGNDPLISLLTRIGFNVSDTESGCCGMAGSFGYEKENYEVSMKIGEQVLFPAVRKMEDRSVICAPGFSCRHQIADGTGRSALHPAALLDAHLVS